MPTVIPEQHAKMRIREGRGKLVPPAFALTMVLDYPSRSGHAARRRSAYAAPPHSTTLMTISIQVASSLPEVGPAPVLGKLVMTSGVSVGSGVGFGAGISITVKLNTLTVVVSSATTLNASLALVETSVMV